MLVGLRPAGAASGPPGSASVLLACTVDEEFTHTGSSRLAETRPRGRAGDRRRADLAQPGPLPQGRPAVEDPHPGRRLPQLDARTWASTPSTGWAASSRPSSRTPATLAAIDAATRSSGRRACRSAGSRGGRASTSFPTGARSRSIVGCIPGEDAAQMPGAGPRAARERLGEPGWDRVRPALGAHAAPRRPGLGEWLEPLGDAVAAATGRRPSVMGVPFGTDAGPLSARGHALRRLRSRRHRPGPHQGRMDRPRAGPARRRGLLPDRLPSRRCRRGMSVAHRAILQVGPACLTPIRSESVGLSRPTPPVPTEPTGLRSARVSCPRRRPDLTADPRLPAPSLVAIRGPTNDVYSSGASIWEVGHPARAGEATDARTTADDLPPQWDAPRIAALPIDERAR